MSIYFDNAATTMHKPPQVARAVAAAIDSFGGAGRGAHEASLDAGMTIHRTRKQIARLFNAPDAKRVVFGLNVTDALNAVIDGLLGPGDAAVTTAASHNSVLRPLFRKQDREGVAVTVVPIAPDASLDLAAFEAACTPATKVAVVTHASNLTGDVYDVAALARIAHAHGALLVVDAAQTAGLVPIDMQAEGLDVVCFTGHKSLYGPQGTGGAVIAPGVDLPAYREGGTGVHSYDRRQPELYPEHLEAGTPNAHGLAGLSAGLSYIEDAGVEALHEKVGTLAARFEAGVRDVAGVTVLGGHATRDRCGIVALNVGDVDAALVADALARDWGICVRAGAHCAPLMHRALGTEQQGAVRFSFSSFTTEEEIDAGIEAVRAIAGDLL